MRQRKKGYNPGQKNLPLPEFQKLWETKGLFSEHYIRTKLKESSVWPQEEEVKPVWEFCKNLWNKLYITLARSDEELTRQEFLEPVLSKLGFVHLRNKPLPIGRKEPDYLLFEDEATKDKVLSREQTTRYTAAISLMEAKKVNHPLGAVSRHETPGKFPHQQVREYLDRAVDSTGEPYFNWAILTNGNCWRLYCRNVHPDYYFELNFEQAVKSFENFKLFIALFQSNVFVKDAEGRCALDYLREETLQHQTKLESDLRKRVFTLLERLANGFYLQPENKISENNLDELYANSLIFLYRLLFILYAEGRDLLPAKLSGPGSNIKYRKKYSLNELIPQLRNPLEFSSDVFTGLYEKLLGLFHLINGDQPSRNKACDVPLYNGGLFNHKEYPLLEKWRIGERTLADVLQGLMFSNIPVGRGEQDNLNFGETIDYADLEVRQLGSIYEGLLEKHLELKDDGHLKLEGDKTQRKATGTYYTPDYIVQYIVKNTVEPLCAEIDKSPEVQNATKKNVKDNFFAKEVLKLNILDPAMGSGHFLVRATEFLAEKIVNHPTTQFQTESVSNKLSREEIVSYGKIPIMKGLSHEQEEISYWRRRVVESCIYGIDLNPLAVELSKLSLWLTCIAADQPLSFLDHHLRPGNSIIGAKLKDLGGFTDKKNKKQISLPFGPNLQNEVSKSIEALNSIEETESRNIPDIKQKESIWQKDVRDKLKPYRTVADLWTSTFFGSEIDEIVYQHLAKLLVSNPKPHTKEAKELKKVLKSHFASFEIAKKKRFFHWELEFPEVFFNKDGIFKENPGFDAVIGNPPYIRFHNLSVDEIPYFSRNFNYGTGQFNAFSLLMEKGFEKLKNSGYLGFIIPDLFLRGLQYEKLRKMFLQKVKIAHIVELGDKVFIGVQMPTCLFLYKKDLPEKNFISFESTLVEENKKSTFVSQDSFLTVLGKCFDAQVGLLLPKILRNYVSLGEIATISRGIEIGKHELKKVQSKVNNLAILSGDGTKKYLLGNRAFINAEMAKRFNKESAIFAAPKIMIRETGSILSACFDEDGILTLRTLHNVHITDKKVNEKYILALLNSKVLQRIFELCFKQSGEIFPKIRISQERQLPIPRISFATPKFERKNLTKTLKTMVEAEKFDEVLNIVEKYLPKDKKGDFIVKKEKSDVVHDLLVFLAERMIEMNKKKQKLAKEFLSWLEQEIIKSPIESVKNKTKIKAFHKYNFDTLLRVLKENGKLPKLINFGDKRQEALEKAYENTMAKLQPLKDKIAATDNLIDQIVYKLYGLTEKEIRIVEGRNKIC